MHIRENVGIHRELCRKYISEKKYEAEFCGAADEKKQFIKMR